MDLCDGGADRGGRMSLFSTAARLTTANDAALEGLHLETFLPADEWTRRLFGVQT